jgi:hypothetical protein
MDKRQPSRNAELGLSTRAIHHGYDPAEEHGALPNPRSLSIAKTGPRPVL